MKVKKTKSERAYEKIVREDWKPTTRELYDYLGVEESWGGKIKRTIKQLAAEDGHVWGYHPVLNCLVLAPKGNLNDAREIINYSSLAASRQVAGLKDQIMGAQIGKLVTDESATKARKKVEASERGIERASKSLEWIEQPA